jgi:hypothetical protein
MKLQRLIAVPVLISFLSGCPNLLLPKVINQNTSQITIPVVPEEPIIPEEIKPVERNDLITNITLSSYSIGDKFSYSGTLQNNTSSNITINNSSRNNLEYTLLRDGEVLESFPFKEDVSIELKELGYIELNHTADKMKFSISNANVSYSGKDYEIPSPLRFSKTMNIPNLTFSKSGTHEVKLKVIYSIDGTQYESIFKTGEFEVK